MGTLSDVPLSSGAHHWIARTGAGRSARDAATKVHAVCCVDTVRSLAYSVSPSDHVNGRARYALCPGPAPKSARCKPRVSNHEFSILERIRAMSWVTVSFVSLSSGSEEGSSFRLFFVAVAAVGNTNSGMRFPKSFPFAYSRYGAIAASPTSCRYTSHTRDSPCRAPPNVRGSYALVKSNFASGAFSGNRPIRRAKSTTSAAKRTLLGSFMENVDVLAWLACANTAPSGTRVATHTAPFSKAPFPMSSMSQALVVSTHENDSPSLAYPCVCTKSSIVVIAQSQVLHLCSVIQIRLP
mmetsp:Transcript_5136/g.19209  ORF Transcript_5136/g.19209 Transcript_5136/m.19209 type:complete len:296 (+) Transcript_5136:1349-2236(+)